MTLFPELRRLTDTIIQIRPVGAVTHAIHQFAAFNRSIDSGIKDSFDICFILRFTNSTADRCCPGNGSAIIMRRITEIDCVFDCQIPIIPCQNAERSNLHSSAISVLPHKITLFARVLINFIMLYPQYCLFSIGTGEFTEIEIISSPI
ncbi:hypothetical protein SDC9_123356 [bioreactor metagenome]|uniref:Uncharacterized protein n=1 Tax=bioreactor metagenome TaxID=1076179 RepID=A0A645CHI5_9ZZZZ